MIHDAMIDCSVCPSSELFRCVNGGTEKIRNQTRAFQLLANFSMPAHLYW